MQTLTQNYKLAKSYDLGDSIQNVCFYICKVIYNHITSVKNQPPFKNGSCRRVL